jgi:hypothetical protein
MPESDRKRFINLYKEGKVWQQTQKNYSNQK